MELHTYELELAVVSAAPPATLRVDTVDLMLPTASRVATADDHTAALLAWADESGALPRREARDGVSGHAEVLGRRRAYAVLDHPLTGPRLAVEISGFLLPFAGFGEAGVALGWVDHSPLLTLNLADHLADHQQLLERPLAPDPVEVRDSLIRLARAHQQALKLGDCRLTLAATEGYEMNEKARGERLSGRRVVLRSEVHVLPGQAQASAVMHWFGY